MSENKRRFSDLGRVAQGAIALVFAFVVTGFVGAEEAERGQGEKKGKGGRGLHGGFDQMLEKLDQDADEAITLAEFSDGERVQRLPAEYQEKLFQRLDKDQDGKITRADIPSGPPKHHPRHFGLRRLDKDKDGDISLEEFLNGEESAADQSERRKKLFSRLDRNEDGVLNRADWKRKEGRRGEEEKHREVFASLDVDEDGLLSLEEFREHPRHVDESADEQERRFKELDRNADGFLEPKERGKRLRPHPPGERNKKKDLNRGA